MFQYLMNNNMLQSYVSLYKSQAPNGLTTCSGRWWLQMTNNSSSNTHRSNLPNSSYACGTTYRRIHPDSLRSRLWIMLLSSLLFMVLGTESVFAQTAQLQRAEENMESTTYTVIGVVESAPEAIDGHGLWSIHTDNGQRYSLITIPEMTRFLSAIPQVDDTVYIEVQAASNGLDEIVSIMVVTIESTIQPDTATARRFLVMHGSLLTDSPTVNGVGRWRLLADSGQIYDIDVHSANAFSQELPAIGQDVYVQGWRMAPRTVSADTVEVDDGNIHRETTEQVVHTISGQVIGEPDTNKSEQTWQIRDQTAIHTVRSNKETIFTSGQPQTGDYVHVSMIAPSTDQLPLAVDVTADTFASGEIIVRLDANINVATVANRYQLTIGVPHLTSVNIHRLFSPQPNSRLPCLLGNAITERSRCDVGRTKPDR